MNNQPWPDPPLGRQGRLTVELDFDGTVHDYRAGWRSPRKVDGDPTPGALQWLVVHVPLFDVAIVSARSPYWGGRRAMRRWLYKRLKGYRGAEVARRIVRDIRWPRHKTGAFFGIDDRVCRFTGGWPTRKQVEEFRPWQKIQADRREIEVQALREVIRDET